MKKRFIYCLLVALSIPAYARQSIPDSLASLFSSQLAVFPQEKIYLHTDKPDYIAGERIWFRAHLVDAATHVPCPVSRYVYVELYKLPDSLVSRVKILQNGGVCHGHVDIPQDIQEGDCLLRAYTRYMLNLDEHYLCTRTVRVINPHKPQIIPAQVADDDFDVSFYPEGGYLLQGVSCRVAFRARLPFGVLHLALFDAKLNPVSERLVFVNNDDQARVSYRSDPKDFEARTPVENQVILTGDDGSPLTGSFSVAVTADHAVTADTTAGILTQLLLASDLRGHIENPAFYFRKEPLSAMALDLLMMTHGWRRYDLSAMAHGQPVLPAIPPETGAEISGRVRKLLADQPLEKAILHIASSNGAYFELTETDGGGRFVFTGCDQPDSVMFIVKAVRNSWHSNLELLMDMDTFPKKTLALNLTSEISDNSREQYAEMATQGYRNKNDGDVAWSLELSEVTVSAKKTIPKVFYRQSFVVDKELIDRAPKHRGITSVAAATIPGISLSADGADTIRYWGFPLRTVIIDDRINTPLQYENRIANDNYLEYILSLIDPENVTQVYLSEIHMKTNISQFPPVADLVIICNSIHQIFYEAKNPGIKRIQPLGYQEPVEFYAPKYDTPDKRENTAPDLRTTIHWQPDVRTDSLGIATFNFYTADAESSYTVIIEGMTADGKIIRHEEKLWKQDENNVEY